MITSIKELSTRIRNQLDINNDQRELYFTPDKIFAETLSGCFYLGYKLIEMSFRNFFPDTADSQHLMRWGDIFRFKRTEARRGKVTVEFFPDPGYIVNINSKLKVRSPNNIEYEFLELKKNEKGEIVNNQGIFICSNTGNIELLADNSKIFLSETTLGTKTEALVKEFISGSDIEPIEQYRERVLTRIAEPPMGGAMADYYLWLGQIKDAYGHWVTPGEIGGVKIPGTVGLCYLCKKRKGQIFPSKAEIIEAQKFIDEKRPVTARAEIFELKPAKKITIEATIDLKNNLNEINARLPEYLINRARPGLGIKTEDIQLFLINEMKLDKIGIVPFSEFKISANEVLVDGEFKYYGR